MVENTYYMRINGTKEDYTTLIKALWKMKVLQSIKVNGEFFSTFSHTDESIIDCINELDNTESMVIEGDGPEGNFELLEGCQNIFQTIAKQIKQSDFYCLITGIDSENRTNQQIHCSFQEGTLVILDSGEYRIPGADEYIAYVMKKLPYKKFAEIFKLDVDEFDQDSYENFVLQILGQDEFDKDNYDYDEIMEFFDDISELDEDDFEGVMDKIENLKILSFDDYVDEDDSYVPDISTYKEYTYIIE